MRGEHTVKSLTDALRFGSSPHARGTRRDSISPRPAARFIPTCVGNTQTQETPCTQLPVHPHMRGEHHMSESQTVIEGGSSPHAWGTHHGTPRATAWRPVHPHMRGEHVEGVDLSTHVAVHPHMRGEHKQGGCPAEADCGSSPHAWGTPVHCCTHRARRRFIPTCVGNTCSLLYTSRP